MHPNVVVKLRGNSRPRARCARKGAAVEVVLPRHLRITHTYREVRDFITEKEPIRSCVRGLIPISSKSRRILPTVAMIGGLGLAISDDSLIHISHTPCAEMTSVAPRLPRRFEASTPATAARCTRLLVRAGVGRPVRRANVATALPPFVLSEVDATMAYASQQLPHAMRHIVPGIEASPLDIHTVLAAERRPYAGLQ